MDFFQACLKADNRAAVNAIRNMIPSARPSAIWAVLMHGAAWHEQITYDTPHSTILVNSIHKMIEDFGSHPGLAPDVPSESVRVVLEEKRKTDDEPFEDYIEKLVRDMSGRILEGQEKYSRESTALICPMWT